MTFRGFAVACLRLKKCLYKQNVALLLTLPIFVKIQISMGGATVQFKIRINLCIFAVLNEGFCILYVQYVYISSC